MTEFKLNGVGDYELEVVGESYYQNSFEEICGPRTDESVDLIVDAHLVPEPKNPHDPFAVRIDVQGKKVGYLPRETAKDYTILLKALKIPITTTLLVSGNIRGGWVRKGRKGNYGIWLDFPVDEYGAKQLKEIAKRTKKSWTPMLLKLTGGMIAICFLCIVVSVIMKALGIT